MDHQAQLAEVLRRFSRRILQLYTEGLVCWGLVATGVLAVLCLIIDHLTTWYVTPALLIILAVLGAVAGALYAWYRRPNTLKIAKTVEQRCDLKEGLSTALALQTMPESKQEFCHLITADALQRIDGHTPALLFPRNFGRPYRAALAVWGAVILLFLLPALPWFYGPEARSERAAMTVIGKHLQDAAHKLKHDAEQTHDIQGQKLARQMQQLGVELEKHRLSRKEALKRFNKLEEQRQEEARATQARLAQEMNQVADHLRKARDARAPEEQVAAERAREKLAAGTPEAKLSPDERAALSREDHMKRAAERLAAGDMPGAADSLRQLGNDLQGTPLSSPSRQELSTAMHKLSDAAKNTSAENLSKPAEQAGKSMQRDTQEGQQEAGRQLAGLPSPAGMSQREQAMRDAANSLADARQSVADNHAIAGVQPGAQQGNQSGNQAGNQPGNQPGQQPGNQPGNGGTNPGGNPGGQPGTRQGGSTPGNPATGPGGNHHGGNPTDRRPGTRGGAPDTSEGGSGAGGLGAHHTPPRAGHTTYREHVAQDPRAASMSIDTHGVPGQSDRTHVPYYEVYTDYRKSAEHAMDSEQIPPGARQRVKDYFEALDPKKQ